MKKYRWNINGKSNDEVETDQQKQGA